MHLAECRSIFRFNHPALYSCNDKERQRRLRALQSKAERELQERSSTLSRCVRALPFVLGRQEGTERAGEVQRELQVQRRTWYVENVRALGEEVVPDSEPECDPLDIDRAKLQAASRSSSVSVCVKPSERGQDGVEQAMLDVEVEVPPTGGDEHEALPMEGVEVEGIEVEGVEVGAGQVSVVAGSTEDSFEVKQEEIEAALSPDRDDKPELPKGAHPPVLQQPSPSLSPHEVTHALPPAELPHPTEKHRSHLPYTRAQGRQLTPVNLGEQRRQQPRQQPPPIPHERLGSPPPQQALPPPPRAKRAPLLTAQQPRHRPPPQPHLRSLRQKPFSHPHPQRSVAQIPLFRPLSSESNKTSSSTTANGSLSGAGASVSSLRIAGIASASSTATANALPKPRWRLERTLVSRAHRSSGRHPAASPS